MKLTNYKVDIKDALTWGDKEQIQAEFTKGVKMTGKASQGEDMPVEFDASVTLQAKYKLLELAIEKIEDNDGNEVEFSKDWMNELPVEDGDKLYEAVDSLRNSKKK